MFYQLWMIAVIVISSQIGSTNKDFSQIVKDWDKYRVMQQGRWSFTDDFMSGFSQVYITEYSNEIDIQKWEKITKGRPLLV